MYEQEAAVGRSQQWRFIIHMHHAFIHPSLSLCVRSHLFRLSIYNFPHTVSEQPTVYWPTRNPPPVQLPPIYKSSFSHARKHTHRRARIPKWLSSRIISQFEIVKLFNRRPAFVRKMSMNQNSWRPMQSIIEFRLRLELWFSLLLHDIYSLILLLWHLSINFNSIRFVCETCTTSRNFVLTESQRTHSRW